MSDRADSFEWAGGHPALDLVNTLDERPFPSPIENLATYRDLVRFVELAGLLTPSVAGQLQHLDDHVGSRIVGRARKLRECLYDVLLAAHFKRAARGSDLETISDAIRAAHGSRVLVSPSPGLVSYSWSAPLPQDVPLHVCSLAIERLLIDADHSKIRKCGAFDCNVFFVDTSKRQHRQWCAMKGCGNREKQRRWRAAQ